MQPTTTILERSRPVTRKHARRGRPAARKASPRNARAGVAAAFRRMARGVETRAAYAATVAFYRSGGQEWTKQLG